MAKMGEKRMEEFQKMDAGRNINPITRISPTPK